MNIPHQVSTFNVKKLGLLAMTPIALVIHGLVLWIPVNTEIKKESEPEKKEELQAIGDMSLPTASPIAIPSTASTPALAPTTASKSSISPVVIEKIVEKVIQTQSQPKSSESPVKKPGPSPTPPISLTPPPTEAPRLRLVENRMIVDPARLR